MLNMKQQEDLANAFDPLILRMVIKHPKVDPSILIDCMASAMSKTVTFFREHPEVSPESIDEFMASHEE